MRFALSVPFSRENKLHDLTNITNTCNVTKHTKLQKYQYKTKISERQYTLTYKRDYYVRLLVKTGVSG